MTKQFDTLVQEANEYVQQRNWQSAIDMLARAHEINPNDTGVLTGLGTCMLHWKGPEEAFPFFQQVIIQAPDSTIAHNNLGLVQKLLGQFKAAEDSYQMSLTLDPDNAQSWKNLAELYLDQDERVGEGVNILQAVVQAHPDDADAWFLLGRCYQEYGDLDSARDLYQRALTLQPDHPNAHNALEELEPALTPQPAPPDMTRIARPEHAKKLASLKSLTGLKTEPKNGGQKMNVEHLIWENNISEEISFWDKWFQTKGLQWPEEYINRLNPNRDNYYAQYINHIEKDTIEMLDVGAGPLTVLVKNHPTKTLNIVAVDPLAPEYDKLLSKYNVTPLIRTILGEAEKLDQLFEPESFDFVNALNCIDHSYDPLEAIKQMVRVVRKNCYVFLSHAENEGEHANYQGLHQYNFTAIDGDFYIKDRFNKMTNISKELGNSVQVECQLKDHWLNVKIKKL